MGKGEKVDGWKTSFTGHEKSWLKICGNTEEWN